MYKRQVLVPVSEFGGVKPEAGDECVLMGNTENPLRQNLISVSYTHLGLFREMGTIYHAVKHGRIRAVL